MSSSTMNLAVPNDAQRQAIDVSVANFEANDEADLICWNPVDPAKWLGGREPKQDALYVEFLYVADGDEDNGYPRAEVHAYAVDGSVVDAHDFG